MEKEIIICAAVKLGEKIWRGHRHNHCIQAMNDKLSYSYSRLQISRLKETRGFTQGFITSNNRFVNRKDAYYIHKNVHGGELFSEDIY